MKKPIIGLIIIFIKIFFISFNLNAKNTGKFNVYRDIYLKESQQELIFGNDKIHLKFDRLTGAWIVFNDDQNDLNFFNADQLAQTVDFVIDHKKIIKEYGASFLKHSVCLESMRKSVTLNLTYGISTKDPGNFDYEFTYLFTLFPEKSEISRSAHVVRIGENQSAHPEKLNGFIFSIPGLKIGNIKDCVFDIPGPFFPKTFLRPETPVKDLEGKNLTFHNAPEAGFGILSITNKNLKTTLAGWMETQGEVTYIPSISSNGKTIDFNFENERSYLFYSNQLVQSDPQHIQIGKSLPDVLGAYKKMCESQMPIDLHTPEDIKEMILMEVYPDYFEEGFKGITKKLPFYKEVGINAVYMMPHWEGGYSPIDFYKINPIYGTEEDLKELIKKAKSLGMKFFFDMVIHGFSEKSPVLKTNPELFVYDSSRNFVPHPVWKSISTDWASPHYQQYMADLAQYHTKTFGIDGYRLDAATYKGPGWDTNLAYPAYRSGTAAPELMKKMLNAMHLYNPSAVMLSEVFGPAFYTVSNFVHDNQAEAAQIILDKIETGEYTARDYKLHMLNVKLALPDGANRVFYTRNHDTSWFYYFKGYTPLFMAMEAIHTLCAIPEIFSGDPKNGPHPDDKKETYEYYKKLFSLKKTYPELSKGDLLLEEVRSNNDMIFTALRSLDNASSLIVISMSPKEEEVEIMVDSFLKRGLSNEVKLFDGISQKSVSVKIVGNVAILKIKPYQVIVGRL